MTQPHFTPELLGFLADLKENNTREWFQVNKKRYESEVKEPMLRFISDFGPHLASISTKLVADPRPVGGSMFRIYRDVRFSKDKSPYKTHAAAQFRHVAGKDVHAPGYYVHISPGEVFAGAGVWHPDGKTLAKIRAAIVESPESWQKAITTPEFVASQRLSGDSLKRAPRGFDPDHPLIEDLKRKDYVSSTMLSEKLVCRADFIERFAVICRAAVPFMRFLTEAVGLEW
jgi:uncharacterized protein (TIGR02453 family)